MPHDKIGPKELALRAQREERAIRPKSMGSKKIVFLGPNEGTGRPLIPFAGADKPVRGGKGSPNRPKPKRKAS